MEALSLGAEVICSNAACLPEIYKNSVHYIDPYDTNITISEIIKKKIDSADIVLNEFSWEKSGKAWLNLLRGENV